LFVPAHTIWLLGDSDVKARLSITRDFVKSTHVSSIGFEVLQREQSLLESRIKTQVTGALRIKRELSSLSVKTSLSVHTPFTPIGRFCLASERPEIRRRGIEVVKTCVGLAEHIGAQVVNTHPGGIVKITNRNFSDPAVKRLALANLKESLAELVDWMEGRCVMLAVENIPYPLEELFQGYSPLVGIFPEDFVEIFRDIDSKVLGLTVDFCHLWITFKTLRGFRAMKKRNSSGRGTNVSGYLGLTSYESEAIKSFAGDPFEAFMNRLNEKVVHVHAADSDGVFVPGKSMVSEGIALGEGDLDLNSFARALREIERTRKQIEPVMIVLEPKELDFGNPRNSSKSQIGRASCRERV
jgi:sugar phosphate isomerase/epimerase